MRGVPLFWSLTMKINLINKKAQTIIEYVAIILVVISVFMAMGAYYKRSLQGRYRQAGDVLGGGEQYTPR